MKHCTITITLLLLLSFSLKAQNIMIDGIEYRIEGNTAFLVHINPMWDSLPDTLVVPEQIKFRRVSYPVTRICDHAFYRSGITHIVLPNTIDSIESFAFSHCYKLLSIIIPDGIHTIPNSSFHSCSSLKEVTLPSSILIIDDNAFIKCNSLESIIVPDSCTQIGNFAFSECNGMKSMTIGLSVKSIMYHALSNLQSIESITINALTPPDFQDDVNYYLLSKKLYVPENSLSLYQQHEKWGKMTVEKKQ